MSLAVRFYNILVDALRAVRELEADASLLHIDRVLSQRFNISESTVRNWRRGRHSQVAPATALAVTQICSHISPAHVAELEFIARLSRGVHEVRLAAELLVDQLSTHVLTGGTDWHIYSGPLKIAFDPRLDAAERLKLMNRSGMVVERILEMGIDQADIPCVSELIRYSIHGWYLNGLFRVREASLSSQLAGLRDGYLDTVEAALYLGDGCAVPCLLSGNLERAHHYILQAENILHERTGHLSDEYAVGIHDAWIMLRSIQALIDSHWTERHTPDLLERHKSVLSPHPAQNAWIEGIRQEVLGYIELVRRADFATAAHHFEQAGCYHDQWLARYGIPFSSTASQSLRGYALLMVQGPTEDVRLQISEGLIRTLDLGIVSHQIRARVCQSVFHESRDDQNMARFHRERAETLVRQHNLAKWYDILNMLLLPWTPVHCRTTKLTSRDRQR